jgi:type I restriction enzyme R subunit
LAPQPEQQARGNIDRLLEAAGWHVCDASAANIHAARDVAIREFPLPGYGLADYLLYVDGNAAGVIEAQKEGVTLTGVETLSDKYTKGLPAGLPRWSNPLPGWGEGEQPQVADFPTSARMVVVGYRAARSQ